MSKFEAEAPSPPPTSPVVPPALSMQETTETADGGRWVVFDYCISFGIVTLRRPSREYFLRSGQWAWVRGLPYSAISLLFGWWGLPWGVILTPVTVLTNLTGGRPTRITGADPSPTSD